MGAYLSEPITDKETEVGGNRHLRFAATAMQGWRTNQEDAHNAIADYDDDLSLFAVYDGHGGWEVAQYTAQRLPEFLKRYDKFGRGDFGDALRTAFVDFDASLLKEESVDQLRLIANKPKPAKRESSSEDDEDKAMLLEEADIPLEALLRRYGLKVSLERQRMLGPLQKDGSPATGTRQQKKFISPNLRRKRQKRTIAEADSTLDDQRPPPTPPMQDLDDTEEEEDDAMKSGDEGAEITDPTTGSSEAEAVRIPNAKRPKLADASSHKKSHDIPVPDEAIEESAKRLSQAKVAAAVEMNEEGVAVAVEGVVKEDFMLDAALEAEFLRPRSFSEIPRTKSAATAAPSTPTRSAARLAKGKSPSPTATVPLSSEATPDSTTGGTLDDQEQAEESVAGGDAEATAVDTSPSKKAVIRKLAAAASSAEPAEDQQGEVFAPKKKQEDTNEESASPPLEEEDEDEEEGSPRERSKSDSLMAAAQKHDAAERRAARAQGGSWQHVKIASSTRRPESPETATAMEDDDAGMAASSSSSDDDDDDEQDDSSSERTTPDEDEEGEMVVPLGDLEDDDDDDMALSMPHGDTPGEDSGTTACVALLIARADERRVVVANAGDSRCVLSRARKALDLSVDHKPEDTEELQRIQRAGGRVSAEGRVNGGLNLSRALGDHFYKKNATLPLEEQMISCRPDIMTMTLTEEDNFLIIACDGIWNSLTSQEVIDYVQEKFDEGLTLPQISEALCDKCLAPTTAGDGTGCDNMTVVLVDLKSSLSPV